MQPEDHTRILHMIEAADALSGFVTGRSRSALDADLMLLFAVVRAVDVFGEASGESLGINKGGEPGNTMAADRRHAKPIDTRLFRH